MLAVSTCVRTLVLVAALVVCAACVETPPLHQPDVESSHVEIKEYPAGRLPKLDLLVVLDDSVAMLPHRERIATLVPLLARQLAGLSRTWTDLQIAVTGNAGQFRALLDTDVAVLADAWQLDYTREASYAGRLHDALAALLVVEPATDTPSQPLEAMRLALERNALFVRDDATLAVLLVSARDDASPLPVSEYVRWMGGLAGDLQGWARKAVVVVGIHPEPAPRLDEYFAALKPAVFVHVAALDGAYGDAVWQLAPRIRTTLGLPCLGSNLLEPGLEDACTMHVYLGDSLRPIPACEATTAAIDRVEDSVVPSVPAPPCWELAAEPQCTDSGVTWRFRGYNSISHPAFRLECRAR